MDGSVGLAIIGVGGVSAFHHVPAIQWDDRARLVAICDRQESLLRDRQAEWNVEVASRDYADICRRPEVDGVIIATPNDTHVPIALCAIQAGKHVMCEKPLGLNTQEVRTLYHAARDAGIVHMTAFTYRFAPAMQYIRQLVRAGHLGEPRHFRSQRFLDLPETSWGWRQYQRHAGAGDLFDMTIHRIDFAMDLMGPLRWVCGAVARFARRDQTAEGVPCAPSEVDDWSGLIGEFASGAVGVWEGSIVTKGYHVRGYGHEWAEVNGSEGTAVYRMHQPNTVLMGKPGGDLEEVPVPEELLRPAGSPRPIDGDDPARLFRYDLVWEFVSAICDQRPAVPGFYEGLRAQVVADAVLESHRTRRWIEIPEEPV